MNSERKASKHYACKKESLITFGLQRSSASRLRRAAVTTRFEPPRKISTACASDFSAPRFRIPDLRRWRSSSNEKRGPRERLAPALRRRRTRRYELAQY